MIIDEKTSDLNISLLKKKKSLEGNQTLKFLQDNPWSAGVKNNSTILAKIKKIDLDNKKVTLDTGLKADANIPLQEFGEMNLQIGQLLEINYYFDGKQTEYSYSKAVKKNEISNLETLFLEKKIIFGTYHNKSKSGYLIDLGKQINGLLPYSSLPEGLELKTPGEKVPVRIIRFDKDNKSIPTIILSMPKPEEMIVSGKIKNIEEGQLIVELSNNDQISFPLPEDFQGKIGSQVRMKQGPQALELLPMEPAIEIKKNTIVKGQVVGITPGVGAFVRIAKNIDGFLHISETSWGVKTRDLPLIGKELEFLVLSVERNEKNVQKPNIQLSLKRVKNNLFEEFSDQISKINDFITKYTSDKEKEVIYNNYKDYVEVPVELSNKLSISDRGDIIISGEVTGSFFDRNKNSNFIIMDIYKGLDGLISFEDLVWEYSKSRAVFNDLQSKANTGYIIKAKLFNPEKIASLEQSREQIFLGIKQLQDHPIDIMLKKHAIGSTITGKISYVGDDHILIDNEEYKPLAAVRRSDYSKEYLLYKSKNYNINDEVSAKVKGADYKRNILMASIKDYEQECDELALKKYAEVKSSISVSDLFSQASSKITKDN